MPARNPEAVCQRPIDAVHKRSGRPAIPNLDPVFVALNHSELPVRARSGGELAKRVRRAEDYAALGARVVVELRQKPRHKAQHPHLGDRPPRPAAHRLAGQRTSRAARRLAEREHRRDPTHRPINPRNGGW